MFNFRGPESAEKGSKEEVRQQKKNTHMKRTNKIKVLQESLCCCAEVVLKETQDVLV